MTLHKHGLLLLLLAGLLLWIIPAQATEFQCKMELSKAPCWKDFNVKFDFINTMTQQTFHSETLEKGVLNKTITLDCKNLTSMTTQATYTPVVWQNMQDAVYKTKTVWLIPTHLPANAISWTGQTCFATDYQSVPLPLSDISHCDCVAPGSAVVVPAGAK